MRTPTETAWQEIATTAMLGTQRKPFQLPALLDEFWAALDGQSQATTVPSQPDPGKPGEVGTETLLLKTAAVTALYRRAGRLPAQGMLPALTPCSPETTPRCSRQVGDCLVQILASGRMPLLAEWAGLATQRGLRVREEHLADILKQWKDIQPLRSILLPVLGERGRWLAGQQPEWNGFAHSNGERTWHESRRHDRAAFLSELRNQDPAKARSLLETTWAQETPTDKAIFLQILAAGLSPADEPFLETVLDDRRKDVRQAAAWLLACLPDSRLVRRMIARARSLLAWKQGLLRGSLEVQLPDKFDQGMFKDGLDEKCPANLPFGEKAWWLAQILAAIPPSVWTNTWGRKTAAILEAARKNEYEEALVFGWTEAGLRYDDRDWIDEIFAHETRRGDARRIYELFAQLPDTKKDPVMIAMLRENPSLSYDQPSSQWLSICRFLWSRDLTQQVTTCIGWSLQRGDLQPWRWEVLLRDIGPYFHPELLRNAVDRISNIQKKRDKQDPYANDLLAVLQFRLEMYWAFEEGNQ